MSPGGDEADGDDADDGGTGRGVDTPSDDEVVEAAATAAEDLVFSRLDRSDVEDYDVTITFEEGILEVDVYVEAPDADADAEQVADDAALVASGAVDDMFADVAE